ncbi:type II restriction endonuclease [Staphylococcus ratti]|uniref:Type-2 restriction enzyme n=1 Tax=Staphylococcus ratti TaxID=2892440 RepID=A0ABY3PDC6_9STAP|nr:type II restriction endonuclease [Staphylococcus ratti]UEX90297.1 type II restriction endonuclease [Staphylococcus ratti]
MNYFDYVNSDSQSRLALFLNTLSETNKTPEYFVNWEKVERETQKYELELTTLNYLIGKDNIAEVAKDLFIQQPQLLKAIPALLAARDRKLSILILDDDDNMEFVDLDFKNINIFKIDEYIEFLDNAGLLSFLKNSVQKNLVDFVYGVETGLDSNAHKNRSGTTMESILARKVEKTCMDLGYEFKEQATASWMKENWDIEVPVDKSQRRFDVAIFDSINNAVFVIETNYYNGGGSKLKSVAGEFKSLKRLIDSSPNKIEFAWVTDGKGWLTAQIPMSEAFQEIPNIFNLEMLRNDFIYHMINAN